MSKVICSQCLCGCQIISTHELECVNGSIKAYGIDNHPEIRMNVDLMILQGTNEVCGLLGDCFQLICENIKRAVLIANEYNSNNPNNNKKYIDFVDEPYKSLITNVIFKQMYAAYIMYYIFALGHAFSHFTSKGAMTGSESAFNSSNSFANISLKQSESLSAKHLAIAQGLKNMFETKYLTPNHKTFPCLPKEVVDRCCIVEKETCENDTVRKGLPRARVLK